MNNTVSDIQQLKDPLLDANVAERNGWLVIDSLEAIMLEMEYKNYPHWREVCPFPQKLLFYDLSIIDMLPWGEALWKKYPNIHSFAVTPEVDSNFFTIDGVLFNRKPDGVELVSVPPAKTGKYHIPSGVTQIVPYAFCFSQLNEVILPSTLLAIDNNAFCQCNRIKNIHIPVSVNRIGKDSWSNAFFECSKLKSVTVDTENLKFYSESGVLYRSDGLLLCYPTGLAGAFTVPQKCFGFANCSFSSSHISEVKFPSDTSFYYIGSYSFKNCKDLKEFRFPSHVRDLGLLAFVNCTNLSDVYIENADFNLSYAWNAFDGCPNLKIHGYSGSTAEAYAKRSGIPWEVM